MIDQTLNTLMCSKRDLATNHAAKHETFLRIFKHCEGVLTSEGPALQKGQALVHRCLK